MTGVPLLAGEVILNISVTQSPTLGPGEHFKNIIKYIKNKKKERKEKER
jgi:hypothetical protein